MNSLAIIKEMQYEKGPHYRRSVITVDDADHHPGYHTKQIWEPFSIDLSRVCSQEKRSNVKGSYGFDSSRNARGSRSSTLTLCSF